MPYQSRSEYCLRSRLRLRSTYFLHVNTWGLSSMVLSFRASHCWRWCLYINLAFSFTLFFYPRFAYAKMRDRPSAREIRCSFWSAWDCLVHRSGHAITWRKVNPLDICRPIVSVSPCKLPLRGAGYILTS
ncbi:hypothetical protein GGS20DRAFT_133280 [Poronia punctata]|nr:hypothetical protein GGS20DRAFT_133280 [Poronia punctata]